VVDVSGSRRPKTIERRMNRFLREPASVRNAASVIVTATVLIVVGGGIAIRAIDHREYSSIWEGMWWALQTVTTVGYGDVTPKDAAGRIVGAVVMLEGIAFLAIITAAITSTFVTRAQRERQPSDQAEETGAQAPVDPQLEQMATQLARVESLLQELTKR
jgi:voltage-gated potassium channel